MEEGVEVITVSELLRRGRPLTAASSLNSSLKPHKNYQSPPPPPPPDSTISNPNPKILTPLNHPAVLIGFLTLPSKTLKCSDQNCFQFSDDSGTLCCDVLDFGVRVIGKRIRVLAWNFIPLKRTAGGFLEIIKWSFFGTSSVLLSPCSNLDSVPLVAGSSSSSSSKDKSEGCYCVHGPIESVSPVSIVPCSNGSTNSHNLRGFVVRIRVCECKLCNSKDPVQILQNKVEWRDRHYFRKPLLIYFCGSSSWWHPAITKLVGFVIMLTGLKKKLVFTGKDESQLMFVTTNVSVLHFLRPSKKWLSFLRNDIRGKGECGVYTGVVKGVYMQGMVVELDKEVWLLLTNRLLTAPHSLRVGAVISVKNAHFVNPKFCWTKALILGTCFKSSIIIESFSPLETRCNVVAQSQSKLGKFIESLTYSARLWALLAISCFLKKFAGILSEKEILGSKHKEGLAQIFTASHLPPAVFRTRHGVLEESCKHDSCSCCTEPYCGNLKLVAPISTFIHHCEATWLRMLLQLEKNCHTSSDNTHFCKLSSDTRCRGQPLRKIFPSNDIGVFLLGSLKISPSSGRLQLIDVTGGIDVIIPDLPSTWNTNSIYQVVNYSLVMEGTTELSDHLGLLGYESLSCRHIFHCTPWPRETKLKIYAYFHLSHATCKNYLFYPSANQNDVFDGLQSGRFHLISITHKYPVLQKFQGDKVISERSSVFAEAIILPWDIFLAGKGGIAHPVEFSKDQNNEPLEHYIVEDYQVNFPNKKRKTDQVSSEVLASHMMEDQNFGGSELSTSSGSCKEPIELKCKNICLLDFPCLATVRSGCGRNLVGSGKLCFMKCKEKYGAACEQSMVKVLLEFNSESFFKYLLLQIDSYYIIKHHTSESFCSIKEYDKISGGKVLITSEIHLWSISFSSDEVVTCSTESVVSSQNDSSFSSKGVMLRNPDELLLQCSTSISPDSCSEVSLHFSVDMKAFLEGKLIDMKGCFINSLMPQKETLNDSPLILTTMYASGISSGSFASSCIFPKGNLVSVIGHVISIHNFDNSAHSHLSCENCGDIDHTRYFLGITDSLCIHVMSDNHMVSIFGSLSKHAYPVGFGTGVVATFHRILKVRGRSRLMLTPVSFIVINLTRDVCEPYHDKCAKQSVVHVSTGSHFGNASFGTISELIKTSDCKPMQINCRIVAVHILVLQNRKKYDALQPKIQSMLSCVDFPLAGFVLDDGSSSCCCWANYERAATLLRLHEELPHTALGNIDGCQAKWMGIDNNSRKTSLYHLERILKKYDRITVKNYGSMLDSCYQDLTVSVSSDNILSRSDENILKFIILNACASRFWTVVASKMDSDAVRKLEKEHLVQMEITTQQPMQNVWAQAVNYTDALIAARNLIHELLNR